MLRLRQRRGTRTSRKAIGAVVIAGVLVAGGATGVQFANADTTTKAADHIVVNGQTFDVSDCTQLEVNGENVVCDGQELKAQADQPGGNAAAQASAVALETACDTFAADAAGANNEDGAADQQGNAADQQGAGNQGHAKKSVMKAAAKKMAQNWVKKMKAVKESTSESGNGDADNAEDGAAADDDGNAAVDSAAEVTAAQQALLQACLALAEAKAAANAAVGNADDQAGDDQAGDDQAGDDQAGDDQAGDDQAGDDQVGDDQAGTGNAGADSSRN